MSERVRATLTEHVAIAKKAGRCLCTSPSSGPEDPDWDGILPARASDCPYHGNSPEAVERYNAAVRAVRAEAVAADVPTPERLRAWAGWADQRLLHAMDEKGVYHPAGRWLRLIADALEATDRGTT